MCMDLVTNCTVALCVTVYDSMAHLLGAVAAQQLPAKADGDFRQAVVRRRVHRHCEAVHQVLHMASDSQSMTHPCKSTGCCACAAHYWVLYSAHLACIRPRQQQRQLGPWLGKTFSQSISAVLFCKNLSKTLS